MITLSWVESEIEKSLRGEASAKNVYDLAALVTVRAYLAAPSESPLSRRERKSQRPSAPRRCICPTTAPTSTKSPAWSRWNRPSPPWR